MKCTNDLKNKRKRERNISSHRSSISILARLHFVFLRVSRKIWINNNIRVYSRVFRIGENQTTVYRPDYRPRGVRKESQIEEVRYRRAGKMGEIAAPLTSKYYG